MKNRLYSDMHKSSTGEVLSVLIITMKSTKYIGIIPATFPSNFLHHHYCSHSKLLLFPPGNDSQDD